MSDEPKDPPPTPPPPADPLKGTSPKTHICFEDGDPFRHPEADSKPRKLVISGASYEHVSELSNGIWVYRQM